uniref:Ubiquitin carboxyl-terminal hydrolase n=1 Tax=Rhabditophanes sp. KR3021 TaxID=114890 RepID=A0AC35U3K0_9BILA
MAKEGTWLALESNPEAINKFLNKMNVNIECEDIFSFDAEFVDFLPRPHLAVILCYPEYKKVRQITDNIYEKLVEQQKNKIPEGFFFMNQTISNACGLFSLIHGLANNGNEQLIGEGCLKQWLDNAKNLPVEDRSRSLFNCKKIAQAHMENALDGETDVPQEEDVDHHFISYVNRNDTLYEFDSSRTFPRSCGPTSEETFLIDCGKESKKIMDQLQNASFSAMMLHGKCD